MQTNCNQYSVFHCSDWFCMSFWRYSRIFTLRKLFEPKRCECSFCKWERERRREKTINNCEHIKDLGVWFAYQKFVEVFCRREETTFLEQFHYQRLSLVDQVSLLLVVYFVRLKCLIFCWTWCDWRWTERIHVKVWWKIKWKELQKLSKRIEKSKWNLCDTYPWNCWHWNQAQRIDYQLPVSLVAHWPMISIGLAFDCLCCMWATVMLDSSPNRCSCDMCWNRIVATNESDFRTAADFW